MSYQRCMCCFPEAKALKKRYAIGNYARALYRSSRIWAPAEPGSGDVQVRNCFLKRCFF